MNIRIKLILRFSLLTLSILVFFSIAVYTIAAQYRRDEFFRRLESRALTTARLLITVEQINKGLLRIIDKNSIRALFEDKVAIFNTRNELVYSNQDSLIIAYESSLLDSVRRKQHVYLERPEADYVGILYRDVKFGEFVVIASAYDRYGRESLRNLRNVMFIGLLLGLCGIVLAGALFARSLLRPIARMNHDISQISAGNLSQRVDEGNRRDELAQLAVNFNQMLGRLEAAFDVQKQFVSSASHELRTPLAAITGQIQHILGKERSAEDYRSVLQSIYDDAQTLIALSNGLLTLAQSELEKQKRRFKAIRLDEILFTAQNELAKLKPDYRFFIEYEQTPEDDHALIIKGDEQLLRTAFINLMDNACKFSNDKTVRIKLSFVKEAIEITFTDRGIGIPPEDVERIFRPFFRAANARDVTKGYGIGLALSRRIVQLHDGELTVQPAPGQGSRFTVRFFNAG